MGTMYAVVGCTDCSSLWVIEVGNQTATCPRCGSRHDTDALRHFAEAEDADEAREARSALVAHRQGAEDVAPGFGDSDDALDAEIVDDAERLEDAGIDPDAVAEAGERANAGSGGGQSRRAVVEEALETLEEPSVERIRAYADERGVPREYVSRLLEKLVHAGEVTETDDGYRLL